MWPPRLGEPANEYGITGLQEQQLDGVPEVLDALQDAGQVGKEDPFPDVDAERDIFDFATLLMTQLDEGGKQRRRKIINAEVPDVLEAFQRVRLPAPDRPVITTSLSPGISTPFRDQ